MEGKKEGCVPSILESQVTNTQAWESRGQWETSGRRYEAHTHTHTTCLHPRVSVVKSNSTHLHSAQVTELVNTVY